MAFYEKGSLFVKDCSKSYIHLALAGAAGAVIIIAFVLLLSPIPGVADQGDFQRVMTVTGLAETGLNSDVSEPHWFKYVVTEYKMIPVNGFRLMGVVPTTSMIYPVTLAKLLSKFLGRTYFHTGLLALVYASIYIISFYICLRWIQLNRKASSIFMMALSLFILMDGGYLLWFNSLYGEPMMITSLLMFIGAVLYASQHLDEEKTRGLLYVFLTGYLFLGSKLQCFVSLPLVILLLIRIACLQERGENLHEVRKSLSIAVLLLFFYVGGIYIQTNSTCGVDTQYNSVFYGILKNSENPEKDLAVLGLPPEMAVEAGKHAYLPKEQYVKYVPWSDITRNEFNNKVSNYSILRFYLLQPKRFIQGMKYTISQSFDTKGSLGKYERNTVNEYTPEFGRFTIWSDIRNTILPKRLSVFITFYLAIFFISMIEYIRRRGSKGQRLRIELLWIILTISILQFMMPYIGNGEADTAKQLFLFNFTFDIILLVSCTWVFNTIYNLIRKSDFISEYK